MNVTATRHHDFSAGHRVHGHENKCAYIHGHNYRVTFHCRGELDDLGRVLDFSVIKSRLCQWLEDNWDHKFLAWQHDGIMAGIYNVVVNGQKQTQQTAVLRAETLQDSIVWTPFNPTAENMARYLVQIIGPKQLNGTGVVLMGVEVEETRKCRASFYI